MCVGTPVFSGKNTVEWVGAAMDGETERLARLGPEVPPELARIIAKATATKPKRRYQSAAEMVADLRTLRRFRRSGVEIAVADAARARKRTQYGVLAAAGVLRPSPASSLSQPGVRKETACAPPAAADRAPRGWEAHPAISPDGRLVAYSSNESGNADIWVVDIASGEHARLTASPVDELDPPGFRTAAASPSLPPTWARRRSGGCPHTAAHRCRCLGGEDPAVSPDGSRVAFGVRVASGDLRVAVARFADRAAVTMLTDAGDGVARSSLPDLVTGRHDDLLRRHSRSVGRDRAGGRRNSSLHDHGGNREPVWSADARNIHFSSVREGPQSLWRVPAGGGEPVRLTQGTGPEAQPSLSRDGRLLAYATKRFELDIEVRQMPSGAAWRIASSAFDGMPAVDPAGRSVAFVSNRLGKYDLWLQAVGAAGPEGTPRRLTRSAWHRGSAGILPRRPMARLPPEPGW